MRTIKEADLKGKTVLLRVDYNVPMDDSGSITDDMRITSTLPTLNYILEHGAKIILCAHLGRPKGKPSPEFSLAPVARRLSELMKDQLLEIRGMDQEKFNRIKDQVFVHPGGIKKFSIAEADENFLWRHPYIGAYNARGIALFIQSQGKEKCTLKSLCENNILSAQDTLRLHPYME